MIYFFIILLLIFIPFPIKILFHYEVPYHKSFIKIYIIKFYICKKNTTRKSHYKKNNINFYNLIFKLNKSKFKPLLYLNQNTDFCFYDACTTSLFYGVISLLHPFIFALLNYIFYIKKYSNKLNPLFINKFYINLNYTGIFFISIAQIIHILLMVNSCKYTNHQPNTL